MRCRLGLFILLLFTCFSCSSHRGGELGSRSGLSLSELQTRSFDTDDRSKVLRAVISSLQKLGFIVRQADENLGTVLGTKRTGFPLKMKVVVTAYGDDQMLVRANAHHRSASVSDPKSYQYFFNALSKSLVLPAQEVDRTNATR